MLRVLRSQLEAHWGIKVTPDHAVYPWMVEWAADLITRYADVRGTGRTAVQIARGSRSSRAIAEFGEKVLYMPLKTSSTDRRNMDDRYCDGIFLGMRMRSDEVLIGTPGGVVKARSVRRRAEGEKWDLEAAKATNPI